MTRAGSRGRGCGLGAGGRRPVARTGKDENANSSLMLNDLLVERGYTQREVLFFPILLFRGEVYETRKNWKKRGIYKAAAPASG